MAAAGLSAVRIVISLAVIKPIKQQPPSNSSTVEESSVLRAA
jgi:hypothetical protein